MPGPRGAGHETAAGPACLAPDHAGGHDDRAIEPDGDRHGRELRRIAGAAGEAHAERDARQLRRAHGGGGRAGHAAPADAGQPSAPVSLCRVDPPDVYDAANKIVFDGGHSWPGGVADNLPYRFASAGVTQKTVCKGVTAPKL